MKADKYFIVGNVIYLGHRLVIIHTCIGHYCVIANAPL